MDDMIRRQAAIDAVSKAKDKSEAHRRLVQLPPAQPGWIPCSTELPKESGEYQVTVQYDNDDYDVVIYEYNAYRKEWNDGDLYSGIVMAWQPKPKPWEGEKP